MVPDGPAAMTGRIRTGDVVTRVNNFDCRGVSLPEARKILINASSSMPSLTIWREEQKQSAVVGIARSDLSNTSLTVKGLVDDSLLEIQRLQVEIRGYEMHHKDRDEMHETMNAELMMVKAQLKDEQNDLQFERRKHSESAVREDRLKKEVSALEVEKEALQRQVVKLTKELKFAVEDLESEAVSTTQFTACFHDLSQRLSHHPENGSLLTKNLNNTDEHRQNCSNDKH